jgi:hypothetical protein
MRLGQRRDVRGYSTRRERAALVVAGFRSVFSRGKFDIGLLESVYAE